MATACSLRLRDFTTTFGAALIPGAIYDDIKLPTRLSCQKISQANLSLKGRSRRCLVPVCAVQDSNPDVEKGSEEPEGVMATATVTPCDPDSKPSFLSAAPWLASLGALETSYLTFEKLTGGTVACPLTFGDCNDVLSSDYSTLFGVPLSAFGLAAYTAVAGLSLALLSSNHSPQSASRPLLAGSLLSLTALMATSSAYLLFILYSELEGATCLYCLTSAGLSFGLLATAVSSLSWDRLRSLAAPPLVASLAVLVTLSLSLGDARSAMAGVGELDLEPVSPKVTTVSSTPLVQLAKHLSEAGARMYGAFWCSHCYEQKQAFGNEATKFLPYVECYPEGYRRGVKINKECSDANIEGFPTWVINGEKYPGEQSLERLAMLTGFNPLL